MSEDSQKPIPQAALDAASDWFARRHGRREAAQEAEFERWLFADPMHRSAYRRVAGSWDASAVLAYSEIGRTRRLRKAPFYQRERTRAAVLASALIVLLTLAATLVYRAGFQWAFSAPAEAAIYETKIGEVRTIALSDGSHVVLDTSSRLEARLSSSERRLILSAGRARFSVNDQKLRPLIVAVPDGEVIAQRTVFDLDTRSQPSRAAILRGTAEIRSAGDLSKPGWLLTQGSEASLGPQPSRRPLEGGEARWVEGMIGLEATPLPMAVRQINRYNVQQIELAGASLDKMKISGAFRARDPAAFVRMITKIASVRVQQVTNKRILIVGE